MLFVKRFVRHSSAEMPFPPPTAVSPSISPSTSKKKPSFLHLPHSLTKGCSPSTSRRRALFGSRPAQTIDAGVQRNAKLLTLPHNTLDSREHSPMPSPSPGSTSSAVFFASSNDLHSNTTIPAYHPLVLKKKKISLNICWRLINT